MQFDPNSPMGRLQTKPKAVRERAFRMWKLRNRDLLERLLREIAELEAVTTDSALARRPAVQRDADARSLLRPDRAAPFHGGSYG